MIAFSLLFVVWMVDLYNFMDGMDGFARTARDVDALTAGLDKVLQDRKLRLAMGGLQRKGP